MIQMILLGKYKKKGVASLSLIIVFVVMGIIAASAIYSYSAVSHSMDVGKVVCPVFCEQRARAPKPPGSWAEGILHPVKQTTEQVEYWASFRRRIRPASVGCYCGVEETEGEFMHVKWDEKEGDSEEVLWEFHITDEKPSVHRHHEVPENFNHEDDCELDTEPIVANSTGCWIYAVDHDGGSNKDGCRLYNVSVGAVLNGTTGKTIIQDLEEEGEVYTTPSWYSGSSWGWEDGGDDFYSPVEEKIYLDGGGLNNQLLDMKLIFGKDSNTGFEVKVGDHVHSSQRFLMEIPTSNEFNLWENVTCTSEKKELPVPPDDCSKKCKESCASKDKKMYMNSECARPSESPGDLYYRDSLTRQADGSCGTGEVCWCRCTLVKRYYWKIMVEDDTN